MAQVTAGDTRSGDTPRTDERDYRIQWENLGYGEMLRRASDEIEYSWQSRPALWATSLMRGGLSAASTDAIRIVHVLRSAEPVCPKCGKGLESEGGSVVPAGSWDEGPLYWRCEDDGEEWGFA